MQGQTDMSIKLTVRQMIPSALLAPYRGWRARRTGLKNYQGYLALLRGKSGLEVGGPSYFFREFLPVYDVMASLDGVNFAGTTLWEEGGQDGGQIRFTHGRLGRQFIDEATDLSHFRSGSYDCVISSNCLEHVANPLKALREWSRVIRPGGYLLLILPNKAANFDHRRAVTPFQHLLGDFLRDAGEDDMTHLAEILELHDLERDPWAGGRDNFIRRSKENFRYRGLHHHVFDLALIDRALAHAGATVLMQDATASDFVVLAQTEKVG